MDLYCTRCGEPWDNDTFHEVAEEQDKTYTEVMRDFQQRGCVATGWVRECAPSPSMRTAVMDAMFDLLGDDVDGAAAMMADYEYILD